MVHRAGQCDYPFGFLPSLSDTAALGPSMLSGIHQGIGAAIGDLSAEGPPKLPSLQHISGALTSLSSAPGTLALPTGPPTITDILAGLEAANTQFVGASTTAFQARRLTMNAPLENPAVNT